MILNKQRGVAQLVVVAVVAFLALGLPIATKLVQQSQENRSQAVFIGDAGGGAVTCPGGNNGYVPGYHICNNKTNVLWSCLINGTWKTTSCEYGCSEKDEYCNSKAKCGTFNWKHTMERPKTKEEFCGSGATYLENNWAVSHAQYSYSWTCVGKGENNKINCFTYKPECLTKSFVGKNLYSGEKSCGTGTNNKNFLYSCKSDGTYEFEVCTNRGMGWGCKNKKCIQMPWINVTTVTVNLEKKSMSIDQSFKIVATVLPVDATNKQVSWKSSNSSVASVDIRGNVVAKKSGKAVITVYSRENNSIMDTVEVTVGTSASNDPAVGVVNNPTYSLSLDPTLLTLDVDKWALVQPTLIPKRTTEVLNWKSSDDSIAKVYIPYCSGNYFTRCVGSNYYLDETVKKCTKCAGIRQVKIAGIKKGTAIITVTASPSGAKKTIKVTVK